MPNDFSASTLKLVQRKLEEVFQSSRTVLERAPEPQTASRLFMDQTAMVNQLYKGDICIGHEVDYMLSDTVSLPTVNTSAPAVVCDIPAGSTLSSATKTYNPNIYIQKIVEVNDKDCDNVFKFAEKVAFNMASSMHLIARALNDYIIAQLVANAQVSASAGKFGTINGTTVEFNTADFDNPDLLADWNEIAILNDFASNYLLLDGTNFYQTWYNARFNAANDDQRDEILKFNNGTGISFDVRNLNAVAAASTFLVDPNMYAFYARSTYPTTATPAGDKDNTVQFSMPLMYQANEMTPADRRAQTFMFNNGGTMQPIMLDVDYQVTCDPAFTDGGRRSFTHRWEMKLEGMFDLAPATAGTGILQFVRV